MTDFEILEAGVVTSGIFDVEIFVLSGTVGFLRKDFSGETGFAGSVSKRIPLGLSWIPSDRSCSRNSSSFCICC